MKLKWLGHSGFKIDNLIIDPFVEDIAAWNMKAPYKLAKEDENIDVIVITHGHADHFSGAKTLAEKSGATGIGTGENLGAAGLHGKSISINIGGTVKIAEWKVTLVQAFHTGNPTGAILEKDGIVIYHTGDTGLFGDMKLIGEFFKPSVALIPIGGHYTMDIVQAAKAAELIGAKTIIPMHYNTFGHIMADPEEFKNLVEQNTTSTVKILHVGEEIEI